MPSGRPPMHNMYEGGRDFAEIVEIMRNRQLDGTPLLNAMLDVKDRYNGPALDYVLPYYTDEDNEHSTQYTPLLMAEIIDSHAMIATQVDPIVRSPAMYTGVQKGTGSRVWAQKRADSIYDVWRVSRFKLGIRRLYRQLSAYGSCAALVFPDDTAEKPRVEIRDALTAFPDLRAAEDFRTPEDCGFITGRSAEWLRNRYPECAIEAGGCIPAVAGPEERLWDVVEWVDSDIISLGILGQRETRYGTSTWQRQQENGEYQELRRWPNKANRFPGMLPARVTLDTILSQVMNLVGHVDLIAKLQMLDVIASERAIFPDMFILGSDGRPPKILSKEGNWQEGRTGYINKVLNASHIGTINAQPDPLARATTDRIERNIKMSAGLTPQMSGETYGPLRTGRAIDALQGVAIDPRIHELQEIMMEWLPDLNAAILATYKGYYGGKTFSLYRAGATNGERHDFTPNQHVETLDTVVRYPVIGADVVQTNVVVSNMIAAELSSKRTAMALHPWIEGDGEEESRQMDEEHAELAVRDMITQLVLTQAAPPILLVLWEKNRRRDEGGDSITAFEDANRELQELQAKQAQEQGPPVQVAPPEAMPGAASGPGGGSMQMPSAIAGPNQAQAALRELTNAIDAGHTPLGMG